MGNGMCNCSCPNKQDEILAQAAASNTIPLARSKNKTAPSSESVSLDNIILKEKALSLCREQEELDEDGQYSGYLSFLEHYLSAKTINLLFTKENMEYIGCTKDLSNILSLTIIIYKAQVFKTKNKVFNNVNQQKTRFQKSDIKPIAKYLAKWIILNYFDKSGEIYITEEHFKKNMYTYLEEFSETEW
eukprot:302803_1